MLFSIIFFIPGAVLVIVDGPHEKVIKRFILVFLIGQKFLSFVDV